MTVTMTPRRELLIEQLFDALANYDCLTHEDIAFHGGMTIPDVGYALSLVRHPDLAVMYGWTVPHVPRGRPAEGQRYRYRLVGLAGEVLDAEDIGLIRAGALSTLRAISSETRNEAHALRLSALMVPEPKYKKWAKQTATILDGVSASASLEVERLMMMAKQAVLTPTP